MAGLAAGPVVAAARSRPDGHYALSDLVRSEWTKLRTVRSTMWTLAVTVVVGLGVSALATAVTRAHWATMTPVDRATFDPIFASLAGSLFGQLAIGVLGVLVMSAEYGTGTIRATFAAAPRRPLVLLAKVIVFGTIALAVGEVTSFASFLLGQALLTPPATHATLSSPGALRAVAGTGLFLCVIGLFALAVATLVRHTAGGISAFVGILLVLPVIVGALPQSTANDIQRFLPLTIGHELARARPDPNAFSPWTGLLVLVAYTVALLAAGSALLVRRDA